MWSRLPPRFVARMLHGHTVVGLAASVLLYILCLSGTVMVFHEEFTRWEQPGVPEIAPGYEEITPATVHLVADNALARVEERPHHFFIGLPVNDMPRMTVSADEVSWYANAQGDLVDVVHHPWTEFLTQLHYYLTLPGVLGLTLVGILGMLMTALVISGVLAHPKLFRDAFRLRLKAGPRLRETDTHNRLGVWATPFHLVVAFTGAALGLATLVAFIVGGTVHEGASDDFFAPIFGADVEGSKQEAPLADITTALNNFHEQHPHLVPWYVSFHDPATVGQSAEILAQHPRRVVYGDNYHFNASGELIGNTGLADGEIGQQIAASLYPLHFGSFGGLPVKLAYGIFGLLACVVVASGINIWLLKRRQRGRPAPALERAWQATLWGTPAVMSAVLLLTLAGIDGLSVLIAVFWLGLAVAMSVAVALPRIDGSVFRQLTGVALIVAVVIHFARYANAMHSPAAYGVNVALLLIATWMLYSGLQGLRRRTEERVTATPASETSSSV